MKTKKVSRPRITPQIEQDIKNRLDSGRTPEQIREVLKGSGEASSVASLATIYRIKKLHDVAQEAAQRAERRLYLGKIKKLLMSGSKYNATEASELIYNATGEKL